MKAEFEAFRAHTAQGGGVGSASAVSTTLHMLLAAVCGPQVLDYSRYDSPCYHDLCERSGCYGASFATKEVDLIFDNATDISVIGDERLALDLEPIDAHHLRGFNGASSRATAIPTRGAMVEVPSIGLITMRPTQLWVRFRQRRGLLRVAQAVLPLLRKVDPSRKVSTLPEVFEIAFSDILLAPLVVRLSISNVHCNCLFTTRG